jgi:hypothetical protein
MILSSFKIYTNVGKLEPATRNNLDQFGFGYQKARDPRVKIQILLVKKHNRMQLNSRFGVHEEGTNITKRINLSD